MHRRSCPPPAALVAAARPRLAAAAGRCHSTASSRLRRAEPGLVAVWRPAAGPATAGGTQRARYKATLVVGLHAENASRKPLWRLFSERYERLLDSNPILTKSLTSGVLYGAGDTCAQVIGNRSGGESFDWGRCWRATVYGGLFYAIPAHLHYNFLQWAVVTKAAVRSARVPYVKMFVEQFVYWSYATTIYYHAVLGGMQGMSVDQIKERISSTFLDTLLAQWAFWCPAQLTNFMYVPVRHQMNYVLVVSLFWTTFLSLAFPPPTQAAVNRKLSSSKTLVVGAATQQVLDGEEVAAATDRRQNIVIYR